MGVAFAQKVMIGGKFGVDAEIIIVDNLETLYDLWVYKNFTEVQNFLSHFDIFESFHWQFSL